MIEGKILVLITEDGGRTWEEVEQVPHLEEGVVAFAASGTSVAVHPPFSDENMGTGWIGLGGGPAGSMAKVLITEDYGVTWDAVDTTVEAGRSTRGIFSLEVFHNFENDTDTLLAVGG